MKALTLPHHSRGTGFHVNCNFWTHPPPSQQLRRLHVRLNSIFTCCLDAVFSSTVVGLAAAAFCALPWCSTCHNNCLSIHCTVCFVHFMCLLLAALHPCMSEEDFVAVAASVFAGHASPLIVDGLFVRLVNQVCDALSVDPVNLQPAALFAQVAAARVSGLITDANPMFSWSEQQIAARFCVMLHLNQLLVRVLPLVTLAPRDDIGFIGTGCSTTIRTVEPDDGATSLSAHALLSGVGRWHNTSIGSWLRCHRGFMFTATKLSFWNGVLAATATPTSLSQDEYEDPREIRLVKVSAAGAVYPGYGGDAFGGIGSIRSVDV